MPGTTISVFFGERSRNALPHLGNGVSGHAFQSPSGPPGKACPLLTVNILWGLFNLPSVPAVCRVGP